jgi:hypothetical protein
MLNVAIGHSEDFDSSDAIEEILEQCKQQLKGKTAQAGVLYAAIDHEFDILIQKINDSYPGIELIGCSTDGEFTSMQGFTEDSSVLILFDTTEIDIKAGIADKLSVNMDNEISKAVQRTRELSDKEAKICFINPTSLTVSGELVLKEFQKNLGEKFPIFGGTAADRWQFKKTYQFYKNSVFTDAVPFLIFSGPILFSFGVASGWNPLGQFGTVTRAENNILYTINNKSATEYFKHYLGENIDHLGEYPLAVFEGNSIDFYLRSPLSTNIDNGSLTFAGDIPINSKVQITHANRDAVITACKETVEISFEKYPGREPSIVLCVSCAARKQVLGTRVSEEIELIKKHKPDIPIFGFYAYGEISPLNKNQPSRFHNETFLSLLLGTK